MTSRPTIAGELFFLLMVLFVSLGLATLPYWSTGESEWIADGDVLYLYLPMGANAYRGSLWPLTDPTTGGPSYYQPLPVVPGLVVARLLQLGPGHISLCWHLTGGLMVAAAWYLLLRLCIRPVVAAPVACLLLADPGVMQASLGYRMIKLLLWEDPLADNIWAPPTALSLPQWRILNPVLSWPWWLLFLALLQRAVLQPSTRRILVAGIACGLLFHIYFYLWTAAIVGLVMAALLDRRYWRVYLGVLAIGGLIGLPVLMASAQFRAQFGSDWLHRTDKFLPIRRFDELLIPRVSWLVLVLGAAWLWPRFPHWRWLVMLAAAPLLLLNQSVVTGLQIENFHWNYALGPPLSLLLVITIAEVGKSYLPNTAAWQRRFLVLLWAWAATTVTIGSWLYIRAIEKAPLQQRISAALADFRSLPTDMCLPNTGTVAGDTQLQCLVVIYRGLRPLSGYTAILSPISNEELDLRIALNAYLLGQDEDTFLRRQTQEFLTARWGPQARSVEARKQRLADRQRAWREVVARPQVYMERFQVRVLVCASDHAPPQPTDWQRLALSTRWAVWVRPFSSNKNTE
jgi:hypothetical protein